MYQGGNGADRPGAVPQNTGSKGNLSSLETLPTLSVRTALVPSDTVAYLLRVCCHSPLLDQEPSC